MRIHFMRFYMGFILWTTIEPSLSLMYDRIIHGKNQKMNGKTSAAHTTKTKKEIVQWFNVFIQCAYTHSMENNIEHFACGFDSISSCKLCSVFRSIESPFSFTQIDFCSILCVLFDFCLIHLCKQIAMLIRFQLKLNWRCEISAYLHRWLVFIVNKVTVICAAPSIEVQMIDKILSFVMAIRFVHKREKLAFQWLALRFRCTWYKTSNACSWLLRIKCTR